MPASGELRVSAATHDGVESVAIDALHAASGVGVTVHVGRAWTNNEALVGVLRMAAANDVRIAAVIVPDRYKGSSAAPNVHDFLLTMSRWKGVHLDLDLIAVISY